MDNATPNIPADLKPRLDEAVRRIVQIAHPRLVILFGSHAERRSRGDSDVDLLVVAETPSWHRLGMELRRAIRPVLGSQPFDLLVYPPESWEVDRVVTGFVAHEADRKGVRLYHAH